MNGMRILLALALMAPLAALGQTPGHYGYKAALPSQQLNGDLGGKQDFNGDISGQHVTSAPGGPARTERQRAADIIQAADYGVKCDGVTDDSPALQAALNAGATLGGRIVMLPASGHACRLATGVSVSDGAHSGTVLEGSAHGMYWPGPYDNTEAHWTAFGTWVRCEDLTNSCISLNGNGSALRNVNFWYTQPTPPGAACGFVCIMQHGAWAPTQYPYAVTIANPQNFNSVTDVSIINGSHCIDVEGGPTGVATIYTHLEHIHAGCFNVGLRMRQIDNTVSIVDWRDQPWWFPFNPNVVGYTMGDAANPGHRIGWDFHYVSGLQATNVEFYLDAAAIAAADDMVGSGLGNVTFAVQAGQWTNISFNQVCQAVRLANSTTHFNARMANVIVNIDPQTSGVGAQQCGLATPYAFDLNSDNVDVAIANLDGYLVQSLARIGGGTSGILRISGARVQQYSTYGPGAAAVTVATGAALDMPADLNAIRTVNPAAGPRVAGSANWPTVSQGVDIEGAAGTTRQLRLLNAPPNAATGGGLSTALWGLRADGLPQSGGNAGANFGLDRYADDGSFLDTPLSVNRATGVPSLPNGMILVLPTSCSGKPTGTVWNNNGALNACP